MKKQTTLLVLILVFALILAGAYVLYDRLGTGTETDQLGLLQSQPTTQPQQTQPETSAGETAPETTGEALPPAPDFTVFDLEGNPVKLSDYFGKPLVVNFWASWCGPCKMEMPDFQEKYQELEGEVQFLMINMTDNSRETVETASGFITQQGYTFPVFYDTASEAAYAYQVYSLPTTYFIDAQGHAIAYATGAIDSETLQRGINMIR